MSYYDELKHIKNQTKEMCFEAVKNCGFTLQYVKKQNRRICLEAVKQNINSLILVDVKYTKFIKNYLESINFRGLYHKYNFLKIENVSDLNILLKYKWFIKYIKQNLKLCKLIITHKNNLSYVNYKKLKLCLQIIKTYNDGFQYINKQYIDILL